MKLTNLKPVFDYEVEKWLISSIPELTVYQKQKIRNDEIVRFSGFQFYKRRKRIKVSILWRLTFFLLPLYFAFLLVSLPFGYLFTGKWGFGQKFYDNFHAVWFHKLGL